MIINIRGTSGSGKSTIIRELFKLARDRSVWDPLWSEIPQDLLPRNEKGELKKRKQPWGYVLEMPAPFRRNVVVIGHYETACGGCDTIPSFDLGFALVRAAHKCGYDVVYEGLLYSADSERTLSLHRDGLDLRVIALNTPLDDCIASVNERRQSSKRAQKRAEKGEEKLPDVNPKNTESKFKGTQSTMAKLQAAGVKAHWCSREGAIQRLVELLTSEGRA